MKSTDWLRSTRTEQHDRRTSAIALLDEIGPQLERFNPGAAEYAFRAGQRMRLTNDRLAAVIARLAAGLTPGGDTDG